MNDLWSCGQRGSELIILFQINGIPSVSRITQSSLTDAQLLFRKATLPELITIESAIQRDEAEFGYWDKQKSLNLLKNMIDNHDSL